jgi:hypothetical protein
LLLMSSLFTSPLIAPLLAFLLALGNAPAWLHCGQCRQDVSVSATSKCDAKACCGCSVRMLAKQRLQNTTLTDTDDTSGSSHDSSDCVACRAAFSASPAATSINATPLSVTVCYALVATSDSICLPRSVIVHRLRGPPVASTI